MSRPLSLLERAGKVKEFLGARVVSLMIQAVAVGFLLFAIESSFILVVQGFLRPLGILEPGKWMLPEWYPQSILASMLILIAFGVVRGFVQAYRYYLSTITYQSFNRLQRERILAYGLAQADETSTHEVMNAYGDLVNRAGSVLNVASQMVLVATSSLFLLLLGAKLAPVEMAMGIALLALCLFPLRYLNNRIGAYGAGLADESEAAGRVLVQGLRHHFFLRVYGLIPAEIAKGIACLRGFEATWKRYQLLYALKSAVPQIAGVFVISLITYVSVQHIHTPTFKLLGFFYLFVRLAQAASDLGGTLSEVRVYLPGIRKLYEYLGNLEAKERSRPRVAGASGADAGKKAEFRRAIERDGVRIALEKVRFGYEGARPLFQDFDLEVKLGDTLVIQGESGTGKSTLLTLLLGLNQPAAGAVRVNGFPVAEVREPLSEALAYVGPEPYLIQGTVRENLLYGHHSPRATADDELWAALRTAQLERDVRALPGGLSEKLMEHTQLSTGQKQRMAIARAILRKPRLLVLDEASANLDAVTEENFIASLKGILHGLTTVIISHKPTFNGIATRRLELKR